MRFSVTRWDNGKFWVFQRPDWDVVWTHMLKHCITLNTSPEEASLKATPPRIISTLQVGDSARNPKVRSDMVSIDHLSASQMKHKEQHIHPAVVPVVLCGHLAWAINTQWTGIILSTYTKCHQVHFPGNLQHLARRTVLNQLHLIPIISNTGQPLVVVQNVDFKCSGTKCLDAIWAQITHTQDKADLSDSDKAWVNKH